LQELGERLYEKITEIVIPEWQAAFAGLTLQDCIDYIFNLTINRTFDGFIREKSVVNEGLAKIFPKLSFEESDPELDHAGNIDYITKIGNKAISIQIKPITAQVNFGNYSATERMKASFANSSLSPILLPRVHNILHIFHCPVDEAVEMRQKRVSRFAQAVFDPRRHFGIYCPDHQTVGFQRT
jgi:hypothetical protein